MSLTRLSIEPTNICNLNCKHCWSNKTKREKGYMDFDFFKSLILEAKLLHIESVNLNYSGESTLHPKFAEMIRFINDNGMKLSFATNGIQLNDDIIDAISKSNKPSIGFSLHNKKYFDTVFKNINNLILKLSERNKQKIGVSVEVGEHTEETLKYIVKHCPLPISIKPSIKDMKWDIIPEHLMEVQISNCTSIHKSMYILWDGKVTLCCRDISCEMAFGDVKSNGIYNTWMSKEYIDKRINVSTGNFTNLSLCKKCELFKVKFIKK